MNKAIVILILGFVTVFVHVKCDVVCPDPGEDDGQSTYFPHETYCGLFYECVAGRAALLECPEGLYWDQRLRVCNWDVNCGSLLTSTPSTAPPTTTTPIPTTNGDDSEDTEDFFNVVFV